MPGTGLRPTQDKVREAVFNVIREKIPGSAVLDLYAGSGAFGIEALSRGAHLAIFVDDNTKCIRTVESNLSSLEVDAKFFQLFKRNALKAIESLRKDGSKFDIIFLDPPYHGELAKNSLIKVDACDIVSQHGFVIIEHFKKNIMPEDLPGIRLFKRKKYGDTVISFYINPNNVK